MEEEKYDLQKISRDDYKKGIIILLVIAILLGTGITYLIYRFSDHSTVAPVILEAKKNHRLEFEYLGDFPSPFKDRFPNPCKLYLMTDTSLEGTQDLRVRRRYCAVCPNGTVTLTEYDVKIR